MTVRDAGDVRGAIGPYVVAVLGVLVWRTEPEGVWRVALEHLG